MATVGANDVAERLPPENRLVEDNVNESTFIQRCSNDSKQRTVKVIHPLCSGRRIPDCCCHGQPDLALRHNSPLTMQDLDSSRGTRSSTDMFRQSGGMGGERERPTHEKAAEAADLERINALRVQVAEAQRLATIRELERQLDELRRQGDQRVYPQGDQRVSPQREGGGANDSTDKSGFPR